MDRRSIVYRAIERTGPARVPIHYVNRDFESSDICGVGFAPAAGFVPSRAGETEWGYTWERLDDTMGQPSSLPLADWNNITRYVPPDPCAPGRFSALNDAIAQSGGRFVKFVVGITGFNQATFLRGMEEFLADLYIDRARAERVLDIVFTFENAIVSQACQHAIDAVTFGDDWGTQNGLILSPELWREVFRPRYAAQFEIARAAGKKVWFHSCGDVSAILGDLIDIGVDVIELLQPDLLGIERLSTEFGGKVCFCCSVDHQRRAISGTPEEIMDYARRLRDELGRFNGGLIGYIEDYSCLGMSERNYQAIRRAFHGLEPYYGESD